MSSVREPARLCAVLAVLLGAGLDPASAAREPWRPAGPWGGDVPSVAVDPRDPDYVLAGTAAGQIFVSRDAGDGWRSAVEAPFAGWAVEELMFDPNHSHRVWAALKGSWQERGFVALSEDRGLTWAKRSRGLPDRQVYSLEAVPGDPGTLYAGTRVGVFVTEDHGRSWRHLTADRPEIEKVTSLLVDRRNPQTILAGTWRRAYRSDDGGRTWRRLDGGMALDSEVFSLTAVPGRPGDLWASTCGWVYRGSDGGESWERVTRGLSERRTPSFEILSSGRMLAGTVSGIFVSDDDGRSWRPAAGGAPVTLALSHHPARPDRVFAGSEGLGVLRSLDGGLSFAPASRGLSGLRVAGLARAEDEVLAAVHHAHSASGLYSSSDGGESFTPVGVELPTILDLAAEGERVFAATERGLYQRDRGGWRALGALGERRVDEVVVAGGRLFARSGRDVYGTSGSVFSRVDLPRIEPRRLALSPDSLWLTDRGHRLYRLPAEMATGQVVEEVLASSPGPEAATWSGGSQAAWVERGGGPSRLWATGDPLWPYLVAPPGGQLMLSGARGHERVPLDLPLRARDVAAALIVDDRLLVATTGFGVLVRDLPASRRAAAAGALTAR